MLKWILLFAVALIAYRYIQRFSVVESKSKDSSSAEQMLECAFCQVRFPESEVIRNDGRNFCCQQHCSAWKPEH